MSSSTSSSHSFSGRVETDGGAGITRHKSSSCSKSTLLEATHSGCIKSLSRLLVPLVLPWLAEVKDLGPCCCARAWRITAGSFWTMSRVRLPPCSRQSFSTCRQNSFAAKIETHLTRSRLTSVSAHCLHLSATVAVSVSVGARFLEHKLVQVGCKQGGEECGELRSTCAQVRVELEA